MHNVHTCCLCQGILIPEIEWEESGYMTEPRPGVKMSLYWTVLFQSLKCRNCKTTSIHCKIQTVLEWTYISTLSNMLRTYLRQHNYVVCVKHDQALLLRLLMYPVGPSDGPFQLSSGSHFGIFCYASPLLYLDTHFRLLREELQTNG